MSRNESIGLNTSNLRSEVRILHSMLKTDMDNRRLLTLSPKARAEREIEKRILPGLNNDEKNKLVLVYEDLFNWIQAFFERNNTPCCPQQNYLPILRVVTKRFNMFFELMARNDGAVEKWEKKEAEWADFDRETVKTRLSYLENNMTRIPDKDANAKEIFDGKVF